MSVNNRLFKNVRKMATRNPPNQIGNKPFPHIFLRLKKKKKKTTTRTTKDNKINLQKMNRYMVYFKLCESFISATRA